MKILILVDVYGWAMDRIADGIISIFPEHDFTKISAVEDIKDLKDIDWKPYDLCYVTLTSFMPDKQDYDKFRTTFHGGSRDEDKAAVLKARGICVKTSITCMQTSRRIGRDDCSYTPYGVDPLMFKPEDVCTEKFTCGYAGWASYLMGKQEFARRGSWIMLSRQELDYSLKIAGGIPQWPTDVQAFNEKYPNTACDLYSVNELGKFYNGLDCYLIPDKTAGGPIPFLEAGICGVPSVTAKCGMPEDFVIDGENSFLVESYDEFKMTLSLLMTDPEVARQAGKQLRQDILEQRTWQAVKPYWEEFLFG